MTQDAFRVVQGQLQEGLVTLLAPEPGAPSAGEGASFACGAGESAGAWGRWLPALVGSGVGVGVPALVCTLLSRAAPAPTDLIRTLKCEWHYRPCSPDYYADDAQLNAVLRHYTRTFREASVLVPLGGLRLLRNALHIAGGRSLMLCGDKAYNQEEELMGLRDPHLAVHGSFSFMVNFHAVRYARPPPRARRHAAAAVVRPAWSIAATWACAGRVADVATAAGGEQGWV